MPSAASLVPQGEEIIFLSRPSLWGRATRIALATLLGVSGLVAMTGPETVYGILPVAGNALHSLQVASQGRGTLGWFIGNPGLLAFLVGVAIWVHAALSCTRTTYLVTERRVLASYGILTRDLEEITANRIRGVEMHRGMLGSLLGYGNVVVVGFGGEFVILGRSLDPMSLLRAIESIQV
jgi:hypothetical protein